MKTRNKLVSFLEQCVGTMISILHYVEPPVFNNRHLWKAKTVDEACYWSMCIWVFSLYVSSNPQIQVLSNYSKGICGWIERGEHWSLCYFITCRETEFYSIF